MKIKFLSLFLAAVMALTVLASCSSEPDLSALLPFNLEHKYSAEVEGVAMTIYVDCNVETIGDGTENSPFKTVAEAQAKIVELKFGDKGLPSGGIRVLLASGVYAPMVVNSENSGTEDCPIYYVAEEERGAIITDATILYSSDFEPITDEEKSRLIDPAAAENVVKLDLKKYGLTEDDWGQIYTIGTYHLAYKYEGATGNAWADLYFNGDKMTLARYPNEGWVYTGSIIDPGSNKDTPVEYIDGATFTVPDELAERAQKWQTLDNVWTYGYFMYDWADCSNPVKAIDSENKSLTLEHGSFYGISERQRYYIFNVFEEMDIPGEYYVDRVNGILYLYPPESMADDSYITLACSFTPTIECRGQYVTFKGLSARDTRGHGVVLECDNVVFDRCFITNCRQSGFWSTGGGHTNTVLKNSEVSNIGGAMAINFSAVSTIETFEPCGNVIYNNYIHDFQQVDKTGYAGVSVKGCGSVVSHNEICNAAQIAVAWNGPNTLIEYNEVYNVCNEASDAGALNVGRGFTSYGTKIRYNYIHDLGNAELGSQGEFAIGIYWDDGMAGQTAYGNIIADVYGWGFSVGGGRDHKIYNNIVINCTQYGLYYDSRCRDGEYGGENSWYGKMANVGSIYSDIQNICWNDAWKANFPELSDLILYPSDEVKDNPMLVINPANSYVANNVLYLTIENGWEPFVIKDAVRQFSNIGENYVIEDLTDFPGYMQKEYRLKENSQIREFVPDFEIIPFDEIGRVIE